MHEHKNQVNVPVMVGAGAAFDMLSDRKKQAPPWMREHGLECFFRLLQEPGRLWRRYLIYGTQFLFYLALASLKLKKFGQAAQPALFERAKIVRHPKSPNVAQVFTCIRFAGCTVSTLALTNFTLKAPSHRVKWC